MPQPNGSNINSYPGQSGLPQSEPKMFGTPATSRGYVKNSDCSRTNPEPTFRSRKS
ncbi:hypothetical protein DPMN_003314 [Dreissena polymorpha]|uniref:Uncharacterized protein n=1 Tax=Dreissena polymorpha TaxID=45954 RepID=A0A9D4MN74_DREPO|nr:hypothetical protein DPMN_003314 [Dreissena polymorpha]